ncbi:septum formation initiator family protein [Boudabousia tangfeifanii]|uniref:Septum formation initiator family protein n=1 Tax=Boudabousia tangfeifanii TaxID=1912795 RepID=A0A1D9MKW9_9ACTO|nr:DUF501 domain-containing protein [Boudabousia tangfeifanii]AOZ72957.1 septum formation initiator family protein [Boudabousia tangfeifanii]
MNPTEATDKDLEIIADQLGREPRGVLAIAARDDAGIPLVVATAPRLDNGTPFPTTFYLTHPDAVKACSTLEAEHLMETMNAALGANEELAERYRKAHDQYLAEREKYGHVPEIVGVSAGGMPTRVKCLHALLGHALAAGPGVNPIGDWTIKVCAERGLWKAPAAHLAALETETESE